MNVESLLVADLADSIEWSGLSKAKDGNGQEEDDRSRGRKDS